MRIVIGVLYASFMIFMGCSLSRNLKENIPALESDKKQEKEKEIRKNEFIKDAFFYNYDKAYIDISHDGKKYIFQGRRNDSIKGTWNIYVHDEDLDTTYQILDTGGNDTQPKFSRNGNRIVFCSDKDGFSYYSSYKSRDIYLYDLRSKQLKKITRSEADNWNPVFMYDGSILFVSNRNDSQQEYYNEVASAFRYSSGKIKEIFPKIIYKNQISLSNNDSLLVYTDEHNQMHMLDYFGKDHKTTSFLEDENVIYGDPTFSKDSKDLCYKMYQDSVFKICTFNLDSKHTSLVLEEQNNCGGAILHNGHIYFHMYKDSRYNIHKKKLNKRNKGSLK